VGLLSKSLGKKPKTSDLVLERRQHVGFPFGLDEVATAVTQQQRQRTDDLAPRRRTLAATRHLVKVLSHQRMVSRAAVLVTIGITIFAVFAASAQAAVKDPRKCSSTPAYCASHAAGQAAIAKVKATAKTVAPVLAHCDQTGTSLLRWRCRLNDGGGHGWNVSVTYWGTSAGWRVRATVL
jgi:hypothetical protein